MEAWRQKLLDLKDRVPATPEAEDAGASAPVVFGSAALPPNVEPVTVLVPAVFAFKPRGVYDFNTVLSDRPAVACAGQIGAQCQRRESRPAGAHLRPERREQADHAEVVAGLQVQFTERTRRWERREACAVEQVSTGRVDGCEAQRALRSGRIGITARKFDCRRSRGGTS